MCEQVMMEIQKHNNKINRILNKISQKQPGISQQIDLALYSCLKIQKLIKKYVEQNKDILSTNSKQFVKNKDSNIHLNQEDQLYENALNLIEGFKTATKKLQKKVGILLREEDLIKQAQRINVYSHSNAYYQKNQNSKNDQNFTTKAKHHISYHENASPFSPHIAQYSQSRNKKQYISSGSKNKSNNNKEKLNIRNYINEEESFQQIGNNQSKNISQLDQEIIQLASQIKHIMKGND